MILVFTLFGSLGGYFFKKASAHGLVLNKYFILHVGAGGLFYGTGAILNIITLSYLPYTIVFPLTSITYIWTLLLSAVFLKETLTVRKIAGVLFIVAGSFFLMN
ncbi:EamA family transporter [Salimicrobium flavidum]|uniref:EamA-like transporter family protein n=1 Tax=Salimicrobium flavidum TaxID=570947 RepID=A0A1N7IZ86_9BACI|nr:EamA family transporter [Salimicrobium flavidum]SIS42359.1 EamA-like transporter family protein [Salimicrobium flavidum]